MARPFWMECGSWTVGGQKEQEKLLLDRGVVGLAAVLYPDHPASVREESRDSRPWRELPVEVVPCEWEDLRVWGWEAHRDSLCRCCFQIPSDSDLLCKLRQ